MPDPNPFVVNGMNHAEATDQKQPRAPKGPRSIGNRSLPQRPPTPANPIVASPGTYDQKHVARIAGVEHCVAYGPGPLEEAHRPDESCAIDDLVAAAPVMALAVMELVGYAS